MTTLPGRHDLEHCDPTARGREISPELVLVDPDLAAVARASHFWGEERSPAAAVAHPETPRERTAPPALHYAFDAPRISRTPPAQADEPRLRGWETVASTASYLLSAAMPAVLFLSVLVNLALAGVLLASGGDAPQFGASDTGVEASAAHPTEPLAETTAVQRTAIEPSPRQTATPSTERAGKQEASPRVARARARARAKAAAERTVLALLQAAPRSRVAPLLNRRTGLLRNNVQAVCRRSAARDRLSFVCTIRAAGARRRAAVYVRYTARPGGGWSVTWLRRVSR